MNVIVSNLNKDKLYTLEVDVIKSISGEFEVEEIIQTFSNFFFNRMFLDITAIKNYEDINTIQKLSIGLDVSKIIILLDESPTVNSNAYISKLVSMGIYNFAKNINEVMYLYNNPNSYKDVAHYQQLNPVVNTTLEAEKTTSYDNSVIEDNLSNDLRIIGIKNVTEHAGATSLTYMLKKILSKYYSVKCLEINKNEFIFYKDNDMISIINKELSSSIAKYKDVNIILIDLNNLEEPTINSTCTDVLYLIEPSLLKINKLVTTNRNILTKLTKEKVILNKSLLNNNDVKDFEFEANIKVLHNLIYLNDREENTDELMPLLEKLNLVKRK